MTAKLQSDSRGIGVHRIQPAYKQVAQQLRALVLRGDLAAGERLPNELALSEMFGVSRSTVREALRVLSSQSLVTTSRGISGGSFIAHPEPSEISDFLETSIGLLSGNATVGVSELLEVREMLEVPATSLAAQRRTEDDLQRLEEIMVSERDSDPTDFEEHRAFHQMILDVTGNELLSIVTRPIFQVLRTRFLRENAPASFWNEVYDDHDEIFGTIRKGDPASAATAMRRHLHHLAVPYEQIVRDTGDDDG